MKSGIHVSPRAIRIYENAIRPEKLTNDIPASDELLGIVSKMSVSTDVPWGRRGLLEECEQPHDALTTSIDTASGCTGHV